MSGKSGDQKRPVHIPVLLREVMEQLDLSPGLVVVDGTVGAGGHSQHILKQIGTTGTLIGLDRDEMMLGFAREKLGAETLPDGQCFLRQASYAELPAVLAELQIPSVDRVLLDLGLSSDQLSDETRGFGFETPGDLDLRFDTRQGIPAWQLLETLSEAELVEIMEVYGEERFSQRIASQLVQQRKTNPVRTAADLIEAVQAAMPAKALATARKNPATRVFQALRIAANQELEQLETMLDAVLPQALKPGGRAVIISFHSLEDRMVKQAFKDRDQWKNLTAKPITATQAEQRVNPRCRTAKLRVAVKT
ncbi:16S rRNA (cytosine(1402)-N(4))-methyltransferase RsmH [Gimesia chilikensis]|uniref:16S rRNA (cytosine(1402)-N(4))-methyltransferase RsmH n=1 Tax=Gimesia chilikensis TaxID=2605989 RepID=UPI0011EE3C73|nr:16S rRNA (cytosine(1402)-N(4))-methyltransferase RsmH [Gimesia chilikensis]KAA0131677.1 16S rRNA (cytosine(1402)-N(4))-methyltransferase RsmH [Gimesia chilikensis]